MSIVDQLRCTAENVDWTRKLGVSLARTLYRSPLTIGLQGPLGAGKTTFVQGLAEGLGLQERVVSPSFALESRYGDTLTHIDLYRLSQEQAEEFLFHSDDAPGIRVIEWVEKVASIDVDILITLTEEGEHQRALAFEFRDCAIPDDVIIEAWRREVRLPAHICRHMDVVADVAARCGAVALSRGHVLRPAALRAAAKTHDLLRFIDFASWNANDFLEPTDDDRRCWQALKERYPMSHEAAAAAFLTDAGYPEIGTIVRTHKGECFTDSEATTEQLLLAYADKRARFDEIVTVRERYEDLSRRHGAHKPSGTFAEKMRLVEAFETSFFGGDPLQG